MPKDARDGSRALILALGAGLGVMTAACAYLLVLRERGAFGGGVWRARVCVRPYPPERGSRRVPFNKPIAQPPPQ